MQRPPRASNTTFSIQPIGDLDGVGIGLKDGAEFWTVEV
jgi:hypothetical protein